MNILKNLSSILLIALAGASSLISASSIKIEAGVMPFTLHSQGQIRIYYDSQSRPTQLSYIDPHGIQYATQEFEYGTDGSITTRKLTELDSLWSSGVSTFKYSYTQAGRIREELQSYTCKKPPAGDTNRSLKYEYDSRGNLLSIQAYAGIFFLKDREKVSNRYKSDGRLETRTYYDAFNQLSLQQKFSYDSLGRAIEKSLYNTSLKLVSRTYFDFEVSPGVDMETNYDARDNILSLAYLYRDDQGRLYERTVRTPDGAIAAVTHYTYNQIDQVTAIGDTDDGDRTLGNLKTDYDKLSRPYLYTFNYSDKALLVERIKPLLQLPGTDL